MTNSEFHCPLIDQECITVKHIIQTELINAREIYYFKDNYNDLDILDAAYANLDPEIYYKRPNPNEAEYFTYQNVTSIQEILTRPNGYCERVSSVVRSRRSNARFRSVRTFYDFDITITGYDYNRPQTGGTYPDFYLYWASPTPRHTVRISGKVLQIERWRDYIDNFGGIRTEEYDDSKSYNFHTADYFRFLYTDINSVTCEFTWLSVFAPEESNPNYYCNYFSAQDLQITWHSAVNPLEITYNFFSDETLVGSHTIQEGDSFSYSNPLNRNKIEEVFKINKVDYLPLTFLKHLEITDFAYNMPLGIIDFTDPYLEIPRHCWNLYISEYPRDIGFPYTLTADNIAYLTQICTDNPGDFTRPILEIECDCKVRCPENTCPVECGDHICCYNSEGVSIKTIPLVNYG